MSSTRGQPPAWPPVWGIQREVPMDHFRGVDVVQAACDLVEDALVRVLVQGAHAGGEGVRVGPDPCPEEHADKKRHLVEC